MFGQDLLSAMIFIAVIERSCCLNDVFLAVFIYNLEIDVSV